MKSQSNYLILYLVCYLFLIFVIWIPLWKYGFRKLKDKNSVAPNGSLKIFFHSGSNLRPRDKAIEAKLLLVESGLQIKGNIEKFIPYDEISSVQLHQIPGIMTTIKIEATEGVFIMGVVRLIWFGQFVVGNFYRNLWLFEQIKQKTKKDKK